MATKAGAVWVDVLPSLSGFAAAVNSGTRVPLAAAGKAAGTEYGNGLVGAAKQALSALGVTVGKETAATAEQMARAVEAAESKVSAARTKAANAADKLALEEQKLSEVRSKEGATNEQIARAQANVVKARQAATTAAGKEAIETARLEAARKGDAAESQAVIAATEKLALARQRSAAAQSAEMVAAARFADLDNKQQQAGERVEAAEKRMATARYELTKATTQLSEAQAKAGSSAAGIEANAAKLNEAEKAVAAATAKATQAQKELDAARKDDPSASKLLEAENKLRAAQRAVVDSTEAEKKALAGLKSAEEEAASGAEVAATRFGKFRGAVEEGATGMSSKVGGFVKSAAAMGGVFAGFKATEFAGESLHAAMDFQKGSQVLQTAAGESVKNMSMVRRGLMDISSKTGTGLDQMTEGMYTVEKAGYRGADGLKIMDAAAKGARDEGADLGTVTNALTSIMNSYHIKASDSAKVMNGLMVAAGGAKTSLQDYAGSLSTVLPIASANHIAFNELAGVLGTLTSHGTSAQEATQEMAFAIRNLAAPNMVAIKEMGQLGISSQNVQQNLGKRGLAGSMQYLSEMTLKHMGPAGTVLLDTFYKSTSAAQALSQMYSRLNPDQKALADQINQGTITSKEYNLALKVLTPTQAAQIRQYVGLKNTASGFNSAIKQGMPGAQTYSEAMKKMMGGSNGLNTALMTLGENLPGTQKRIDEVGKAMNSTDDFTKKWGISQKSASTSLQIAKQTMSNMGAAMASAFLPAISKGALLLAHFAQGAADLARTNWGWIKPVALGLTAVGTGLGVFMTFDKIKTSVQGLGLAMGLMSGSLKEGTVAWEGFDAAMDANPIGVVVAGLTALGTGLVLAYKNVGWFRDGVNAAFHGISVVVGDVVGFIQQHWQALLLTLGGPIGLAIVGVIKTFGLLKIAFNEVAKAATWMYQDGIKPAFDWIAAGATKLWNTGLKVMVTGATDGFNLLGKTASWLWNNALHPVFSALGTAVDFGAQHWKVFATILAIPLTPVIIPLVGAFKLLQVAGSAAMSALSTAGSWLWHNVLVPAFHGIGAAATWMWNTALKPALALSETGLQKVGTAGTWLWHNALEPAFHGIGALAGWLWHNAIAPMVSGIWSGMQTLAKGVQSLWSNGFQVSFKAIGSLTGWLWHTILAPFIVFGLTSFALLGKAVMAMWSAWFKPALEYIGSKAMWLWHNVLVPFGSGVTSVLQTAGKWAMWLWNNAINPAFKGIASLAMWLWHNILVPAFTGIWGGMQTLGKWGTWLWRNALEPAFQGIAKSGQWMWNNVLKPTFGLIVAGAKDVGKWGTWLWKNAIDPAFHGIGSVITTVYNSAVKPTFNAFENLIGKNDSSGLRGVFRSGAKAIGDTWNGIKALVAKPVNAVIGFINNPFINTFNTIGKPFGVHMDTISKIPGYARGGVLPGDSSYRDGDDQLAWMRRGEGVYVSEAMRDPRERERLHAVNRAAIKGQSLDRFHDPLPHFDKGGVLGWAEKGLSSANDWAKKNIPGVKGVEDLAKVTWDKLAGNALKIGNVLKFATSQLGKKYVYGAAGPNSFDCSGLVMASYLNGAGIQLPRTADEQHGSAGKPADGNNPGDLLFPLAGHPVPHVALSMGNGKLIEAANPKDGIIGPHPYSGLPNGARRIIDASPTEVSILSALFKDLKQVGKWAGSALSAINPFNALSSILDGPINAALKVFGANNPIVKILGGEAKNLVTGAVSWATNKFSSMFSGGDSGGSVSGTPDAPTKAAAAWVPQIKQALQLVGLPQTPDMIAKWERQIESESSGNPNAIQGNIGDINNKTGDLAKGLVQVIGATFRSYHVAGTPDNIFDPVANLAAGMNYAKHVYGPSMSFVGQGHGYANGTLSAAPGVAEVAENGAEIVFGRQWRKFKGGEQVLNRAQLATLTSNRSSSTDVGNGTSVTINGVPMDSAQQVADAFTFASRRLGGAGKYQSVTR